MDYNLTPINLTIRLDLDFLKELFLFEKSTINDKRDGHDEEFALRNFLALDHYWTNETLKSLICVWNVGNVSFP